METDTITRAERMADLQTQTPPGTPGTEMPFGDLSMHRCFGLYPGDKHTFIKIAADGGRLVVSPGGEGLNQFYAFGLLKPIVTQ